MKTGISHLRLAALPVALSAAFASTIAFAQSADNPAELQQVVVTATRFARPVAEVLADVTVIDRQQIEESGVTSVLQILEQQPGLQVRYSGALPNVYVRGGESRMTGLLVDGVRVGGQDGIYRIGGGIPWETVPLSDIERIEIVRGPSSVQYGSDAMAGAIQIITRNGEAGVHPSVSLGAGSFNSQQLAAYLRGRDSALDYSIHAVSNRSDGYDTRPDVSHSPSTEGSQNTDVGLGLGYQLDPVHRLDLKAAKNRLQSRSVSTWSANFPLDVTSNAELSTVSAVWQAQWSERLKTAFRVNQSVSAYQDDDAGANYSTALHSTSLDFQWKVSGGTLSGLVEQKQDAFYSGADDWGNAQTSVERVTNAAGLGYGFALGSHELQANIRRDQDNKFGSNDVGVISYAYRIAPQWRASASAGTSFRAPTMEQLFGAYGNAGLRPERGQNAELGLAYSNAGSHAKMTIYRNTFDQLISADSATFIYYNVDAASIKGITFSGGQRLGAWNLYAALDLLDPKADSGVNAGNYLSLRALRTVKLGANTQWQSWTLGGDMQDVGATQDDAANTSVNPAYTLLNLYAQRALGKNWSWNLRVNNLTNQRYKPSFRGAVVSAGANFFTTLQWSPQ